MTNLEALAIAEDSRNKGRITEDVMRFTFWDEVCLALKKQVPLPLNHTHLGSPICPHCGRLFSVGEYCSYCGQHITWGKG